MNNEWTTDDLLQLAGLRRCWPCIEGYPIDIKTGAHHTPGCSVYMDGSTPLVPRYCPNVDRKMLLANANQNP